MYQTFKAHRPLRQSSTASLGSESGDVEDEVRVGPREEEHGKDAGRGGERGRLLRPRVRSRVAVPGEMGN